MKRLLNFSRSFLSSKANGFTTQTVVRQLHHARVAELGQTQPDLGTSTHLDTFQEVAEGITSINLCIRAELSECVFEGLLKLTIQVIDNVLNLYYGHTNSLSEGRPAYITGPIALLYTRQSARSLTARLTMSGQYEIKSSNVVRTASV